jgi:copper resistance protein D
MTGARLPPPTWLSGLRRRASVAGNGAGRDHHSSGTDTPGGHRRPSPGRVPGLGPGRSPGPSPLPGGAGAAARRRGNDLADTGAWAAASRAAVRPSHARTSAAPAAAPAAAPTTDAVPAATGGRDLREAGRVGVGLLVGLVVGWVVLVVVRSPTADAGDQLASRIDLVIAETLLAERVLSFSYWIGSVSTLLVIGGAIFRFWVVPPHIGVVGDDGVVHAQTRRPGGGNIADATLQGAAVVGVVAAVFLVPLRTIALSGGRVAEATDPGALWFVATSRFGDSVVLRIAGLAILLLALSDGPRLWRGEAGLGGTGREMLLGRATRRRLVFVAGLVVVLLGYAMTGHPQATNPWVVHVAAQWVHVTVAAAWFGGVCFLAIELRQQWRRGSARYTGEVVGRFSAMAEVTIILAALTGVLLANSQIHDPMAVLESAYGRAFVGKVVALGIVLVIGAYNQQRLVPAIVERDEPDAWDHLRRALVFEVVLIALGVLLLTAVMTSGGI